MEPAVDFSPRRGGAWRYAGAEKLAGPKRPFLPPTVGAFTAWCDAALAMKPTPEQMDRAVAALVPYVGAWGLSLNPEELHELAGAVLTHFDSDASFDAIDAAERARIQEFAREQAEIRRAFRTPTG
jgi:hypothetical protein